MPIFFMSDHNIVFDVLNGKSHVRFNFGGSLPVEFPLSVLTDLSGLTLAKSMCIIVMLFMKDLINVSDKIEPSSKNLLD